MKQYKRTVRMHIQKEHLKVFCILFIESVLITALYHCICHKAILNSEKQTKQNQINHGISSDMEYFPIPGQYRNRILYEDSFGADRIQGKHEGCDIMDTQDRPGEIPVVSCCDGVVTNLGWLFLGGYRIGITGNNGTYFYYAHLDSYAEGIAIGDVVCGGQLIGFMGNSGEGEEGTVGKFPTHLHFGIYRSEGEMTAVNPYSFLKNSE